MLFIVSMTMAGFCILSYDKIIVGKVPYKLLQKETIREILSELHLRPSQTFVDLGCGDGRVLIEAVNLQPKTKCVGLEKAILPYLMAKYKTRNYKNIKIVFGDIKKYDFSNNDIVFAYLLPSLLKDIKPKLRQTIDNGASFVTVQYKPAGLAPRRRLKLKNKSEFADSWYLYRN